MAARKRSISAITFRSVSVVLQLRGRSLQEQSKANGSKVSLMFSNKVPSSLTFDQLQELLGPVLDFTKKTIVSTNIESLPPEFKEAVLAKEAVIGMDQDTVLLAMGIPDRKTLEKVNGIEQEEWQYNGRGVKKTFVTFENNLVVKVTEY